MPFQILLLDVSQIDRFLAQVVQLFSRGAHHFREHDVEV